MDLIPQHCVSPRQSSQLSNRHDGQMGAILTTLGFYSKRYYNQSESCKRQILLYSLPINHEIFVP